MAIDYAALLSGQGGSSSSPYSVLSAAPVAVAPKRKKKDKKPSGIGGFFQNLGSDIHDLTGIPAGIAHIATSGWHDAKKAAGYASGEYRLDDIGKSIYDSYTAPNTFWGETGRVAGNLAQLDLDGALSHGARARRALYEHPLGPALDVAGAITGGAGLVGKLATTTAKTTGSARAMRLAGLQRVDDITPSTIRGVSGPAGKFAAATRPIIDPITGKTLHEMPVHRNPAIRARKAMVEKAYTKLPDGNYLAPTRRGARLGEAQTRRIARRDAANLDNKYRTAFSKLSKDEKDALFYMAQGFNTVERAQQLKAQRATAAAEYAAAHQGPLPKGKHAAPERAKAGADVADLIRDAKVIDRVMPLIAEPSPALLRALEAQKAVDDATQATFVRNMVREGSTPEAAAQRIRDRAQMPLREIGITPDVDEMPMIITHVENATRRKLRGANLETGMTTHFLDEERATTGANFLKARYERDASAVLTTHRLMFAKEQTFERIERALAKAEPFDRAKHGDLVADGKLHWIKKNDTLIKDMQHVEDSLRRLENDLGDFTDVELEALRDTYDAMLDLVTKNDSPGLVLPKAHYDELVGQFKGAKGIAAKLFDHLGRLTSTWKHVVLTFKGSYYVNNFLGNTLLGLVAYGPRYVLDVGLESLPKAMRGATSARIAGDVADLERAASGRSVLGADSKHYRADVISRLGEKVAPHGAKLTEDNFRRAAFRSNLRTKVAEYRKTQPGMTRHEAVEAVFNDKAAVDQLAQTTYGDLLDYSRLTPVERELLLPVLPFWSFTRAMTGRTIRLTIDEPWKMRVLLAFGQHGLEVNEDALPDGLELPAYLENMVMLDPTGELPRILSTAGSNPFTAPVDLASELLSLGGGGNKSPNVLSSVNPFLKAPLEAGFNKDVFMDKEIENFNGSIPEGYLGRLSAQAQRNVPQWAMYQRYRNPSKYPAVERDASDTWAQFLGVPVGNLNPENIEQINNYIAADEARKKAYEAARMKSVAERARY